MGAVAPRHFYRRLERKSVLKDEQSPMRYAHRAFDFLCGALDRIRTLYNARNPELLQTIQTIRRLEKKGEDRGFQLREAQQAYSRSRKKRGFDDLPITA
mgnify:FL=1